MSLTLQCLIYNCDIQALYINNIDELGNNPLDGVLAY